MSSNLQIDISQEQGRVPVTVFDISGEIGSHNYEQLHSKAIEAYEAGMRNLLLNLTLVPYMSSAGLRSIHAIYKLLEGHGEETQMESIEYVTKSEHLKLLNPPQSVLRVIKALGFDLFLEIYTDSEDAIASF